MKRIKQKKYETRQELPEQKILNSGKQDFELLNIGARIFCQEIFFADHFQMPNDERHS